MTTIYLIRHAQAEGNLYRRCQGWYNGLITEKGRAQIRRLERRFVGVRVDAVYSSDLYRTMSTAGAIYRPRGLTLRVDPDLREISGGCWENRPWGQWFHEDRDNLVAFLRCDPTWSAPGSETFDGVQQRLCGAVERIAANHPGQTVAVVSHGSAIRNALSKWLGIPMTKVVLGDNTSVAKLEIESGTVNVVYYNDNSHLGELAYSRSTDDEKTDFSAMEANSVYFEPLPFPEGRELYLNARRDGWLVSHGSMENFDGAEFLRTAERNSAFAPDSVLTARVCGTFVGILQMDFEQQAEELVGRVPFLYLTPEAREKGFGCQLLGQAVVTFRQMGRKVIRLRCAPENEHAQRFYHSLGFHKIGEEPGGTGCLDTLEKYIGLEL